MRITSINLLGLLSGGFLFIPLAHGEPTPEERLVEQITAGEAIQRYDIVDQALYRLESIELKNPELVAAKIRQSLRQGRLDQAENELELLKQLSPDSDIYKQTQTLIAIMGQEGQQELQQARLLAVSGHVPEAKEAYDKLFQGNFPTVDIATEYWRLVGRLPGQQAYAIEQLQAIEEKTPGNLTLRGVLAKLLFRNKQQSDGFDILAKMATNPAASEEVSALWLEQIAAMPVSDESIARLQQYLLLYDDKTKHETVQKQLEEQQKLLVDPGYIARQKGLSQVQQGDGENAMESLKQALTKYPDDPNVVGSLGMAYSRMGDRKTAIELFERAMELDKERKAGGKWESLIKTNRYWLLVKEGGDALKARNFSVAEAKYKEAGELNTNNVAALLGLGDVAAARNNNADAERYYQQALKIEPTNQGGVNRLVRLYQRQSPQKALAYVQSLPPQMRPKFNTQKNKSTSRGSLIRRETDRLKQEADSLEQQQQWTQAIEKLRQVYRQTPSDPWLVYRLARNLLRVGQQAEADRLFTTLSERRPNDVATAYANALYLSGSRRETEALRRIDTVSQDRWTKEMQVLAQRLRLNIAIDEANQMRRTGNEAAAIELLRRQPQNNRIDLMLAGWAAERSDYQTALQTYQGVLQREPQNPDARLGEAEAYIATGDLDVARQELAFFDTNPTESLNSQRRIAKAWLETGDYQKADALFQRLRTAIQNQPPSDNNALIWRDIARSARDSNQPQLALEDYRHAMVAAGIAPTLPEDDEEFTRLTRNNPDDDWLKRSIRGDAGDLYQRQNTTITLDYDFWGKSGDEGISDLWAQTTMLELDTPLYEGDVFARIDFVQMNAGTFKTDDNGVYYKNFGTCHTIGCSRDHKQKADGASFGVGWSNGTWSGDIGTTPLGFEVTDWVGGLAYSTKWRDIGLRFTASRRPISSSLLSFAGTKDPNTGTSWGGVRADGGSLSLSYDRGERHGVWADLSAHRLTGKNVEDNQRARFMGGYYYRTINEANRKFSVGLNSMLWRYQKDLSGYSLGQGGYYSPQSYFSLSVPLNYREKTENWSWELAGSLGWSTSTTKDRRRYPIRGIIPEDLPDIDAMGRGKSGTGIGYTVRALVERRLTSHWSIGAGVDIQQAKNYTPSHALVYLRYSFDSWRGDMDMPPRPLTPYADFK